MKQDFSYKLLKHYGKINKEFAYPKEVNLLTYRGNDIQYIDIRKWHRDSSDLLNRKMCKGISLTIEEAIALRDILNNIDLDLTT